MANQLPTVSKSGGTADLAQLFAAIAPQFGSGKTSTSSSSSADPESLGQADELLRKILGDADPANMDAMVNNILERAKQSFGPAAISSNAAGVRGYSDSVLASSRNEAMARATGEAAAAKLNAINAANNQATNLVAAKLKATATTQQSQKTAASPAGKGLTAAVLGAQGYSFLKKKGVIDDIQKQITGNYDNASVGDFTAGGGFESADFGGSVGADSFSSPASETLAGQDLASGFGNEGDIQSIIQSPDDTPPIEPIGAGSEAAGAATSGVVTGGFPMPPAGTVNPITGLPNAMPPANAMMPAAQAIDDAEAIDALPAADEAAQTFDFTADAASEFGTDASAEVAGEAIGDSYFPGLFTLANFASEGNLGSAVGEVYKGGEDIVGGTLGSVEDVVGDAGNFVTDTIDDIAGGCFITTAATKGGETDNGYMLTKLREFRNSYMQENSERQSELVDYYLLAPFIVKRISESTHADSIWKTIREEWLDQAVQAYNAGFPETTHAIYKNMMYWARQQVGLANPGRA